MAPEAAMSAQRDTRTERSENANATNGAKRDAGVPVDRRRREAAQYIADMILELRNMAKSVQLYHVMVPLEYAYYEAFSAANKIEIPDGEVEHIRKLSQVAAEIDSVPPEDDVL
jgi:hypothetical protein